MYLVWLSNTIRMNTLNQIKYAKWLEQQKQTTTKKKKKKKERKKKKNFPFNLFMPCGLFRHYILDWSMAMFYGNLVFSVK